MSLRDLLAMVAFCLLAVIAGGLLMAGFAWLVAP